MNTMLRLTLFAAMVFVTSCDEEAKNGVLSGTGQAEEIAGQLSASGSPSIPSTPQYYNKYWNIPYLGINTPDNARKVDVYRPKDCVTGIELTNYPVVIFFQGAYMQTIDDDRRAKGEKLATVVCPIGIGVVSAGYVGLDPANPTGGVAFPDFVDECMAAVKWVYDNIGDYGGDNSRIVISGSSAGGLIAALLATDPQYQQSLPQGTVDGLMTFSSPLNLIAIQSIPGIQSTVFGQALNAAFPQSDDTAASPHTYAGEGDPQALHLYGELNPPEGVPPELPGVGSSSVQFSNLLNAANGVGAANAYPILGFGHNTTPSVEWNTPMGEAQPNILAKIFLTNLWNLPMLPSCS